MSARRCIPIVVPLLAIWLALSAGLAVASTQTYAVSGVVLDSVSGQSLPGFAVTLTPDKGGSGQTVRTTNDGRFSFPAVPPGKYILSGTGPGYRAQGLDQHDNYFTGIAVGPKLDATNIVFRMQPDASIRGQVLDEQNEPVRNATAQLFRVDEVNGLRRPTLMTNAGTDDQGFYRFPHLGPGTYYVALSARPWYAQYSPQFGSRNQPQLDADTAARVQQEAAQLDVAYPLTFYPDADDSSQATAITLHPGERFTADIVMRAVPAVHLKIHYDQARQGPGPTLMQRVFDGLLIPVFASQGYGYGQGVFEFGGLAPGHYTLELQGGAADRSGGKSGWYRDIDLYGDMEISASDSPGMATVTGLVTYEGGPPSGREAANIELRNLETGDSWTDRVSDKGLFGLKDNELRPGTYQAELYGPQDWVLTRIVAENAKVQGSQITVSAGASAKLACTATRVSASVAGLVMRDDKPVAGAMVLLVPENGGSDKQRFRRDESDSDGTFTLRQVIPGRYTALAILNGWNLEWGDPAVLMPYLAKGEKVTISADKSPSITLQVQ
ncbi:MAG: carboxypeptidase regulatory-like domain-containing protein [Candidatus Korobacteraceae bacterium]